MKQEVKVAIKVLSFVMALLILAVSMPMTAFAEAIKSVEDNDVTGEKSLDVNEERELIAKDVVVLEENEALRGENIKHFKLSDGTTKAVVYPQAVHYKDENGKWVDIDNALTLNGSEYSSNNKQSIKFANKSGSSGLVSIKDGDYKIDFTPLSTNKVSAVIENPQSNNSRKFEDMSVLNNLVSKAIYRDIYDGIDIEYILVGNNIKENIIVKEKQDSYTFAFELELSKLSAELKDGVIILSDFDSGEQVYEIPAPYMFDAKNEYSDSVEYSLVQNGKWKYTFTVTADAEWINAEERAFPVTVDPMITVNSNVTDMLVENGSTGLASSRLVVGTYFGVEAVSFIRFNQLPSLPEGARLVGANVLLRRSGNVSEYVGIYEATADWTNGIAYENVDNFYNSSLPLDYITPDSTSGNIFAFDITKLYNKWINGAPNYGVCLDTIEFDSTSEHYMIFISSKHTNNYRPCLEITYVNMTGVEDYYSYYSSSAQKAGTGYVNSFTGNLTFVHNIFSTADEILPYNLYLTYNSNLKSWRLSTEETVTAETINNVQHYKWTDSDGTEHWFSPIIERDSNGKYVLYEYDDLGNKVQVTGTPIRFYDQEGLGLTLTLSDSGDIIISDDKENSKTYSSGRLTSIKDSYGNERTFSYNTDGNLNNVYLKANGKNSIRQVLVHHSSNMIQILNFQTGVVVKITYSNSLISSVEYTINSNGKYTTGYEYDSEGLLLSAIDNYTKTKISYTYDENDRVVRVDSYAITDTEQYAKDSATITYDGLTTKYLPIIGGENKLTTVYEFDYRGKVTTAYTCDEDGVIYGAANYKYNDMYADGAVSSKTNNSLQSVLSTSTNTVNILKNADFELGTSNWIVSDNNIYVETVITAQHDNPLNYGNSLRMDRTVPGTSTAKQVINLKPGKYVLSASIYRFYLKDSATVNLKVYNGATLVSSTIHEAYDETITNWNRENLCFEVTEQGEYTVAVELVTSTSDRQYLFIDNMMLEKGDGAGAFSVYPNGSMETAIEATNGLNATNSTEEKIDGESSLKLTSNITNEAYYMYTYNACGGIVPEDLIISFWAKAENAVVSTNENGKAEFCIKLITSFKNTNQTTEKVININAGNGSWQYFCELVSVEPLSVEPSGGNIDKIDIYLVYSYNVGNAYFDKVSVSQGANGASYKYNEMGYISVEFDLKGNTTTYQYAANKVDLISATDQNGNEVGITYDEDRHVNGNSYTSEDTQIQTEYVRNDFGQVTGTSVFNGTQNRQMTTSSVYCDDILSDYFSKVMSTTNENGETTRYYYDYNGLLKGIQNPDGSGILYTYDNYGELYRAVLAEYNENTDSLSVSNVNKDVIYQYTDSHLLEAIETDSTEYTFEYDEYQRVKSIKAGDNTLATYDYVANSGSLSVMTYGNGAYIAYTRDSIDRVISVCYNGIERAEYVYASNGSCTLIKDLSNDTDYQYYYSADGTLLNEKVIVDGVTSYSRFYKYDNQGRLVRKTNYYADGNARYSLVDYSYNADGLVTKIQHLAGFTEEYDYDEFGRMVSSNKKNNSQTAPVLTKSYTYDDTDTVIKSTLKNEAITANGITYNISYSYDSNGNITAIVNNNSSVSYVYDLSGQLIRENNQALGYTYVYTYDFAGNITKKETYSYTTSDNLGTVLETDVYGYEDDSWGDLLTSYNGVDFTYDAIGNPLTYNNGTQFTFTWQNGRELASINYYGSEFEFKYNQDGIRIEKSVGDSRWTYVVNGTKIEKEYFYCNNSLVTESSYYYDANGYASSAIVSIYSQGAIVKYKYLFVTNLQGDVIAVTDENGEWLVTYTYDAWGNFTANYNYANSELGQKISYAVDLPFRYRSYYYDWQTGFYYLNARYYDSKICRFVNADSEDNLGANGDLNSFNLYAYCSNNPVIYTDPVGEFALGIIAVVGFVFVAKKAYSVVVDKINDMTEKSIQKAQKALENTEVYFIDRPIGDEWNDTNENYHTVTAQIDLANDENKLNAQELMIYSQLLHKRCI